MYEFKIYLNIHLTLIFIINCGYIDSLYDILKNIINII